MVFNVARIHSNSYIKLWFGDHPYAFAPKRNRERENVFFFFPFSQGQEETGKERAGQMVNREQQRGLKATLPDAELALWAVGGQ